MKNVLHSLSAILFLVFLFPSAPLRAAAEDAFDQDLLEFIRKELPDQAADLKRLYDEDPEGGYLTLMKECELFYNTYNDLLGKNEETAELYLRKAVIEGRATRTAQSISGVKDPKQRLAIEKKLESLLEELFEISVKELESETKSLENELRVLNEQIGYRKENKKDLIQRRMIRMISDYDESFVW